MRRVLLPAALAMTMAAGSLPAQPRLHEPVVATHMADASAAVVSRDGLLLVANDEDNILRWYDPATGGAPVRELALDDFLGVRPDTKGPEADFEAVARVGDAIVLVGSHGRNKNGKERPMRHRFVALAEDEEGVVALAGSSMRVDLAARLARDPRHAALGLWSSIRQGEKLADAQEERLAPKNEGFNIEALSATESGATLFIGLRNPRVLDAANGKDLALVATLLNPREYLGAGAPPQFGEPLLWDLDGLGMRSMERHPVTGLQYIVAGPVGGGGPFVLYAWNEDPQSAPQNLVQFPDGLSVEGLAAIPGERAMWIVSDDGAVPVPVASNDECLGDLDKGGNCQNKSLRDPARRTFRIARLDL